ncbi:TetR family transcriptional regulator [Planomonospora sp. ID67723]|uniref:TetR/AcrR family transcriptional regulator n=1 Tax=Planomonospora sp. ID67723 TaxID=2738134 RepID=UPI0018C3E067|nr:TetR family transcriptional regulator [Planomonospora sp. ID67723]MBG0827160.1 TetR family transcriptional regulator [Planomonospora sp. ID67723]
MRPKRKASGQDRSFIETARRGQIVQCAIDVIAEVGYAQASLARIAERAGISKGVISYHFDSKDELVQQIVDDAAVAGDAFVRPRTEAQTTAAGMLRAYIEASVEFYRSHQRHMRALLDIWTSFRTEDGRQRLGVRDNEAEMTIVEQILQLGQATGEFGAFSTRVMAVTVKQAVDGVLILMSAYDDLDFDTYARELADLFDRATRKEP